MVKTLAQLGANIDKQDVLGNTPLHARIVQRPNAGRHRAPRPRGRSLHRHPHERARTDDIPAGSTPLSIAQADADVVRILSKKAKSAEELKNVEALNRKLQTAILANDEEGVRAAVERGADVDAL